VAAACCGGRAYLLYCEHFSYIPLIVLSSTLWAPTAQVTYKRVKGNIQGDVLVLTVNRVVNYDEQPSVLSADACEEQCSFVSGCQGWTYCSAAGGCGGGCKAWHDANGPGEPHN
jgi:hypothetical protein